MLLILCGQTAEEVKVSDLSGCREKPHESKGHESMGVVALSVEYRTRDQEVVGSSLGRARGVKTLGMFLSSHTYVPLFTKQYKLVPAKGR